MDLRRALNDKDWPPVRYKLIYGLGSVFARDRRIAVLKFLGENADVKALITSLQAKIFLDSFDWSPIEMPEPRRLTKHFADDPWCQRGDPPLIGGHQRLARPFRRAGVERRRGIIFRHYVTNAPRRLRTPAVPMVDAMVCDAMPLREERRA